MSATLGALKFNSLIGPPPVLPRAQVALHTRAGTGGTGARVQPATGSEHQITLERIIAASTRFTEQYTYRSIIGTVVSFTLNGANWTTTTSHNFLVLGVEITENVPLVRAVGIDPDGNDFDITSAARIVSRWRLVAVPAP